MPNPIFDNSYYIISKYKGKLIKESVGKMIHLIIEPVLVVVIVASDGTGDKVIQTWTDYLNALRKSPKELH